MKQTQLTLFTVFSLPTSQYHPGELTHHPCPPPSSPMTHLLGLHQSAESCGRACCMSPLTHALSPHPVLFFDGPINSGVFNSFGHHNPSSSKALSFLLQRGKKQQVVIKIIIHFCEPVLVTQASSVMITSSVITALIVCFFSSRGDRNVFKRVAPSLSAPGPFLLRLSSSTRIRL